MAENRNVLWELDKTEAQLETDLLPGSVGTIASDTGAYVQKMNDSSVKKIPVVDPNAFKPYVLGYMDPDGVSWAFDEGTRVLSITHSSGTVKFWSEGNYFELTNGDPMLSVTIPNISGYNYCAYDATGQLVRTADPDWDNVPKRNLGPVLIYDAVAGARTTTIVRKTWYDANHRENYASYRTKGLQATDDRTVMTAAIGATATGHSEGVYFTPRDYAFTSPAATTADKVWPIFYYQGLDDNGRYKTKVVIKIPPNAPFVIAGTDVGLGSSNAVYGSFVGGVPTLNVAASGDYLIGHLAMADGLIKVVSIMPQTAYGNLAAAQAAISTEIDKILVDNELFHDVGVFCSFIIKGDTKALQDVGDGTPWYYIKGGVADF